MNYAIKRITERQLILQKLASIIQRSQNILHRLRYYYAKFLSDRFRCVAGAHISKLADGIGGQADTQKVANKVAISAILCVRYGE